MISEAGLSEAFFIGCGLLERKRFAIEPIPPSEFFIIKVLQRSFKDRTSEEDFSWYYFYKMPDSVLIRCKHCGTVNRVPADKLRMHPKCGKCKDMLTFPESAVEVTTASFDDEVIRWPGAVLVEFWSQTCGVCMSLMPTVYDIARQRAGNLKVVLINVESNPVLANRFKVLSLPTFIVYKNGVMINRLNGGLARARLEDWIDASTSLSFRF